MNNIRLFTKSYIKDFPWLILAAETIRKHAKAKVFWTIVVDQGEKNSLKLPQAANIIFQVHEIQEYWPEAAALGSGYIQQQWVKMNAHRVMGTNYFLNWDSDVMALRDFSEADFCNPAGKPILWFTPFNDIINGDHVQVHQMRQAYIKNVFNIPEAPFEWMRCMPIWMNGEILRVGETRNEWRLVKDMLINNQVDGMSEFNLIGQLSHMLFPDAYDYINTQTSLKPTWAGPLDSKTAVVGQCWSWGNDWDGARRTLGL